MSKELAEELNRYQLHCMNTGQEQVADLVGRAIEALYQQDAARVPVPYLPKITPEVLEMVEPPLVKIIDNEWQWTREAVDICAVIKVGYTAPPSTAQEVAQLSHNSSKSGITAQGVEEFNGWYCAHCQRGVDSTEVTFSEQHEVCGRVITDDMPPPLGDGIESLKEFVRKAASYAGDGSDYSGGDIQDDLESLGLVVKTTVYEPCGEGCNCVDYYGDMSDGEFCYRLTPFVKAASKGE